MDTPPSDPAERTRLSRRLRAFVIALGVLLSLNNLLPYVGLRDDSCQTMFSGLEWGADWNNHFFMPQHALSDVWAYRVDVRAETDPPARGPSLDRLLWLNQPARQLNTEAMRATIAQLCADGHVVRIAWRDAPGAERRSAQDACRVPSLSSPHRWVPVRLYETDYATDL